MSKDRKTHLEEEFEKHFASERGAWVNVWNPTWEDTTPPKWSYRYPREDLSKNYGIHTNPDQEEA